MSDDNAGTNAAAGWLLLRAGTTGIVGGEVATIPMSIGPGRTAPRLALGDDGQARVLLPLAKAESLHDLEDTPALDFQTSDLVVQGRGTRFLQITCRVRDLEQIFGEVVDQILLRITGGASGSDAARTTLHDFRSLLVQTAAGVDIRRAAGLVGELLVLQRLLRQSPSAVRVWCGPNGDRHDFRNGNLSLEVKTSLRASATEVSINGLDQLEAPADGRLYLLHLILEPVAGGALTVSTLTRSALALSDSPQALLDLLASIGCPDIDAPNWNRFAFKLEAETFYIVDSNFPRLSLSSLVDGVAPPGVSRVEYRLDLSVAQSCICPLDQYAAVQSELVNHG